MICRFYPRPCPDRYYSSGRMAHICRLKEWKKKLKVCPYDKSIYSTPLSIRKSLKNKNQKRLGFVGTIFKGTPAETNVIVSDKTPTNICYVIECKKKTKIQLKCNHKFKIDPMFEGGAVMMFAGPIGDVKQEMRYVCSKCGEVKYG
jgi:hypothetical protein